MTPPLFFAPTGKHPIDTMNYEQPKPRTEIMKFERLAKIPEGLYPCRKWWQLTKKGGWLDVSKNKQGTTTIIWTNGRDGHDPFGSGRPVAIDIDENGRLLAYDKACITFWRQWSIAGDGDSEQEKIAIEWAEFMDSVLFPFVEAK